ncbi:MAG TPA: hydantoinase/oxoprolinase family protein [Conexibacter sp.]|jgi:N-methylhydantoinase A|nr:hydantoinase/oxoprolinase family protein [Conexibacter sp.]
MSLVLGVDIGGTFTDCIALTGDGDVRMGKSLSTPPDFDTGFIDAIGAAAAAQGLDAGAALADTRQILHGCTVGSNALVERRTAKVALLTSRGHRDSLFTMQAGRRLRTLGAEAIAHVAAHVKPEPLVPRSLVRELDERVAADGQVLAPLDEQQVREVVGELLGEGVEAFAVSLLWSVADDAHEQTVARVIRELAPGAYLSVASQVVARTGEYERTVATVVNALIGPEMDRYLSQLEDRCRSLGYAGTISIMTCSGGLVSIDEARALPVLTIGSGPVAGLIGARRLAAAASGRQASPAPVRATNLITADMGGTTLDVGVVHEGVPISRVTSWYDQYEYFVPTLDVRSIGAGGGSIVQLDETSGTLRVGPRSAGSRPGPVCYSRGGTEPTITDADLVAGFLNPDYFLGGKMALDLEGATRAYAAVGEPLGLSALETASAALRIVDNQMADAIRLVSVNQGFHPRAFTLYPCGGGGALHAAAIAAELGIPSISVPLSGLASGWSAFGVAGAEPLVVQEVARPMREPFDPALFTALFAELEAAALARLAGQGIAREDAVLTRHADVRYALQVNEVEVLAPSGDYDDAGVRELLERFETEYARRYGDDSRYADAGFAVIGLRVRGRGAARELPLSAARPDGPAPTPEPKGHRDVSFHRRGMGAEPAALYDAAVIHPQTVLNGPAIVELPGTSIVVPHDAVLRFDTLGSAHISLAGA